MRESRDLLLRGGCTLEAARTNVAWGEWLQQHGDPNANERLDDALRTFQEAGLASEVAYINSLKK